MREKRQTWLSMTACVIMFSPLLLSMECTFLSSCCSCKTCPTAAAPFASSMANAGLKSIGGHFPSILLLIISLQADSTSVTANAVGDELKSYDNLARGYKAVFIITNATGMKCMKIILAICKQWLHHDRKQHICKTNAKAANISQETNDK